MKRLTIGMAAPGLLAIALLVDICSRFASYDYVSFRGFEALTRNGGTGLGGPFLRNATYKTTRAYGDLAAMGNLPQLRQYRPEVMTTDEWGFRNAPGAASAELGAILFGTSFSIGAGLNDDQTLSAKIAAYIGAPVYNAGGLDLGQERNLSRTIGRLHFRRRIAIVEHVETAPEPAWASDVGFAMRLEDHFGARYRDVRLGYSEVKGWLNKSPLNLALFKMFKSIQDDVILPNAFSDRVLQGELANGDQMLFLPSQVSPGRGPTAVADAVVSWRRLDHYFRARGFDLLVVLIPSQYRVYAPLLKTPPPKLNDDTYVDDLESGLRAAGIEVVNPTRSLMAAARDGLPSHRYIYWRDDTHWTAAGVEITAREIANRLSR